MTVEPGSALRDPAVAALTLDALGITPDQTDRLADIGQDVALGLARMSTDYEERQHLAATAAGHPYCLACIAVGSLAAIETGHSPPRNTPAYAFC